MPRALTIALAILMVLTFTALAQAEISVTISAVSPTDGYIGEGDSATISWKIEADSESGDWQIEIEGDGTWDSGTVPTSSDTSGTFSGTTQGTSTIKSTDLDDGDGDYSIYLIAMDSADETNYDSTSTTITLDNPPDQVTNLSAGNGDGKIFLTWDDLDTEDLSYYLVYYSTSSGNTESDYFGDDAAEGPSPIDAGNGSSFSLSGLENNTRYYVRVSAVDEGGTEGPLSEEAGATPQINFGASELSDEKGGCFIATAAFGDYDHPYVMALRDFRDKILLPTSLGTKLVNLYYENSPPAANWLTRHPGARAATAMALVPCSFYARASVRLPIMSVFIPLFFLAIPFGFVVIGVRRRAK